jgi:hypothetical protein
LLAQSRLDARQQALLDEYISRVEQTAKR